MLKLYMVVIKETEKSENIIRENITYSQVLKYFGKYEYACQLKIYFSEEGYLWKIKNVFENGELIQLYDVKRKPKETVSKKTSEQPFSIAELFETISKATPSRSENPSFFNARYNTWCMDADELQAQMVYGSLKEAISQGALKLF